MDLETIVQTIVNKKQLNTENTAEVIKIRMSILNSLKYHYENGLLNREYEDEIQKWSIHILNNKTLNLSSKSFYQSLIVLPISSKFISGF